MKKPKRSLPGVFDEDPSDLYGLLRLFSYCPSGEGEPVDRIMHPAEVRAFQFLVERRPPPFPFIEHKYLLVKHDMAEDSELSMNFIVADNDFVIVKWFADRRKNPKRYEHLLVVEEKRKVVWQRDRLVDPGFAW